MTLLKNVIRAAIGLCIVSATGCAATRPQVATDLNAGLEVASAVESAYAARPSADPKVVAEVTRLLTTAQAAITAYSTSTSPDDQAAASAAIAALVAYEASAHVTP